MARDVRTIRAAALEALASFRFYEFAPFAWILAAELLLLGLAMNLGTPAGMATAGWLTERIAGDRPLHYPEFYRFLPNLITNAEAILFLVAGSFLIPLAIIRILRPIDPATFPEGETGARVRQAILPVFVGALLCLALIVGWQLLLHLRPVEGTIRTLVRGFTGSAVVAILGMLVGYALWTLFVFVPVVAVHPGRSFMSTLGSGLRVAASNFFPTYLVVIGLSLPAAVVLLVLQVMGNFLVGQIRPEIIGVLVGIYIVCSMFATFFIYAAAARFYHAHLEEAA